MRGVARRTMVTHKKSIDADIMQTRQDSKESRIESNESTLPVNEENP
jgi:hypothetical protein